MTPLRPTTAFAPDDALHRKGFLAHPWLERGGVAALVSAAAWFVTISWRKWCHPTIDSGRELYTPWRLSEGAVLYRDVDDVYGPLSQYFNAGLFRLFGPGLIVLAIANLVIFSAILWLVYRLFRRAWGPVGAVSAGLVFVFVFSFSPFLDYGTFNYGLPYAHEATHGMLVLLALVLAAGNWIEGPTPRANATVGFLTGLTLVLKPEFMLAAAVIVPATVILRRPGSIAHPGRSLALFTLAALAPTLGFFVYFSCYVPLLDALVAATRAWSSLLVLPSITSKQYQLSFLGFDHPWINFKAHVFHAAQAAGCLALIFGLYALAARSRRSLARYGFSIAAFASAGLIGWITDWQTIGRSLLGLILLYLAVSVWRHHRRLSPPAALPAPHRHWRFLLTLTALAMLARMILNGRIFQFGFFQAALAALVVTAVICAEISEWIPSHDGRRLSPALLSLALLLPGFGWAGHRTYQFYVQSHTLPVAGGRDRFYYYPPEIEASGQLLNDVVGALRGAAPDSTLLALPEGGMVNYLARLRSPLPPFQYYSFTTENGKEAALVEQLRLRPPDRVVILSRFGLGDFNIMRYGERDGAGRQILLWIGENTASPTTLVVTPSRPINAAPSSSSGRDNALRVARSAKNIPGRRSLGAGRLARSAYAEPSWRIRRSFTSTGEIVGRPNFASVPVRARKCTSVGPRCGVWAASSSVSRAVSSVPTAREYPHACAIAPNAAPRLKVACPPVESCASLSITRWNRLRGAWAPTIARLPMRMSTAPSPSATHTRRSGRFKARPRPSALAPPIAPTR